MKSVNRKIIHRVTFFLVAVLASLHGYSAHAQTQVVGDPNSCPLCNPPLEIVQLRGKNYNLHEFPVMHLYEGMTSKSQYKLDRQINPFIDSLKWQEAINTDMSDLRDVTRTRLSDMYVNGVYDPYMFLGPYVKVVSQSVPGTLITANAHVSTSAHTDLPSDTFNLQVTAGLPGKTAVAWLVGGAAKGSVIRGVGSSTEMVFILPVVVHPSPLPLHVQEIVVPEGGDAPTSFSLTEQNKGESVEPVSQSCPIVYSRFPYNPDALNTPHMFTLNGPYNCADLLNVLSLKRDASDKLKWVPIKRILVLVHSGAQKDGLPQVTTTFPDGNTVFYGLEKNKDLVTKGNTISKDE